GNSVGVSLKGLKCIDIGCRSGENTLAMQKVGAEVIGIDPDDSEFLMAREKGMKASQLFKMTLQEYRQSFPDSKFDLATVFLWNIFAEQSSFIKALAEVIKPHGRILIGFHEDNYKKDPHNLRALMLNFFAKVDEYEFPLNLNRYMLLCKDRKTQVTL
ncbi:MAG TPA: methyltransferase domain-containing protein, partial [Rhabdochlamydiaceae bacterium]|nr:methyltransferase domain-containing protein [Rhabdochlamydiaceae bacterium]